MNQVDEIRTGGILIVDDEEDIRETLRDVVEGIGCNALLAANGEEALTLLANNRPCLVVIDLIMPGMTGAQVIDAMQRTPDLAKIPVLISTSAPERAPRGYPLLPKPIDVDLLCDWMRRACECVTMEGAFAPPRRA